MTSTDIGVAEDGSSTGTSLQLVGTGSSYTDFSWTADVTQSFGTVNVGMTFSEYYALHFKSTMKRVGETRKYLRKYRVPASEGQY